MGFLYYMPGADGTFVPDKCPDELKKENLHLIHRDGSISWKKTAGPDGKTGRLFASTNQHFDGVDVYYDKEGQEWTECRSSGVVTHWLGAWKERPPSPKTLVRRTIFGNQKVLIRGQEWTVPLVGPFGTLLPSEFYVDPDGEWATEVDASYHDLMRSSERVMNVLLDPSSDKVENAKQQLQFCVDVLSVNYRVSNREVGRMRLLTNESILLILNASLGEDVVTREK